MQEADRDTYLPDSPKLRSILLLAKQMAQRLQAPQIGTEHLLLALLSDDAILSSRILSNLDVNPKQARRILLRRLGIAENQQRRAPRRRPGENDGSDGEVQGTPTLDKLARDLTQIARSDGMDPVVGRDREIKRVVQILSRRTKNNPVLIGEPGVGKTAIAEGLAERIVAGRVPEELADKRLMMLDMGSLVAAPSIAVSLRTA